MAIFSQGGTSYPDILVTIYLVICFAISICLNPTVFIYNWKKKNSVPVFLFRCMAVNDFLTCIFIPIKVVIEAVDSECSIREEGWNDGRSCIRRRRLENSAPLMLYSFVTWHLIFTPNFIAALMAICRFIQIKFPFFPLQLKHLIIPSVIFGAYTIGLSGYVSFHSDSIYEVNKQIRTGGFKFDSLFLTILVYTWPLLLSQILSIVASLLTILHLCKRKAIAEQTAMISKKSSLKILLTNFGSIFNNIAMVSSMVAPEESGTSSKAQFVTTVLTPVLLSCFNPIVFIALTPEFKIPLAPETRSVTT
jgi:hypothetical protein